MWFWPSSEVKEIWSNTNSSWKNETSKNFYIPPPPMFTWRRNLFGTDPETVSASGSLNFTKKRLLPATSPQRAFSLMHLFSTLLRGCHPPRDLSGCSRNHAIYSTYFCDCSGYTDTPACYILNPIILGLRWIFLFLGCDIWLPPAQPLGYLDFPYYTNRNAGEGESILHLVSEKLCIVEWAESIFGMLQKGAQMLGWLLILKFAGLISPEEINFSFSFPSIGF